MRLSDLLEAPVVGADGQPLGFVIDLRCVQDGPLRGAMQAPRVHELIVSHRHVGSLLGYERRQQQGPWIVKLIVRALHRRAFILAWDEAEWDGHTFTLRSNANPRSLPE